MKLDFDYQPLLLVPVLALLALPLVGSGSTWLTLTVALARLAKGVCPGCERTVDLKDGRTDFCPHCGRWTCT